PGRGAGERGPRRAPRARASAGLHRGGGEPGRAKAGSLARVSRELRPPLAAFLGWTRLLRRGGLSAEKQSRALDTLERNARAQTRLVEDLLDVSRIVSGKTRLNVVTAKLDRIVGEAAEAVRPAALGPAGRLDPAAAS